VLQASRYQVSHSMSGACEWQIAARCWLCLVFFLWVQLLGRWGTGDAQRPWSSAVLQAARSAYCVSAQIGPDTSSLHVLWDCQVWQLQRPRKCEHAPSHIRLVPGQRLQPGLVGERGAEMCWLPVHPIRTRTATPCVRLLHAAGRKQQGRQGCDLWHVCGYGLQQQEWCRCVAPPGMYMREQCYRMPEQFTGGACISPDE
jgi:hypothetical protein